MLKNKIYLLNCKAVQRPDQLLPLYVMETLGDYQGFPGLFVAGITCASLRLVENLIILLCVFFPDKE